MDKIILPPQHDNDDHDEEWFGKRTYVHIQRYHVTIPKQRMSNLHHAKDRKES